MYMEVINAQLLKVLQQCKIPTARFELIFGCKNHTLGQPVFSGGISSASLSAGTENKIMALDTIISLDKVSIFQKHNLVLTSVSLNIDKGEFVYLLGKTGSGKSSLLKT